MAPGDRKRRRPRPEGDPPANPFGGNAEAQPTDPFSGEHLHRENVPGALEHSSGDIDEFDAALVRGAHGEPVAEEDLEDAVDEDLSERAQALLDEAQAPDPGRELEPVGAGSGRRGGGGGDGLSLSQRVEQAATPPPRAPRGGNRVIGFLRASWAELQRVQWPDRPQVFQATAVVMGFVAVAGLYLGVADFVAHKVVDAIL
jgi:preprotein translocase subunit SecE